MKVPVSSVLWTSVRRINKITLLLATAFSAVLASMPTLAQDQDSTDQEAENLVIEEVIVSGTRRALQNSIDIKRQATGIVDALSIGDIGDIPSLSVGEAIEQVTGASGHRFKGSVSGISIRGLGPFLTSETFNGRQGTTAAASRSMNYQVFPSELTKSIKIYKTQQADLIEGGTGGTIDVGTMRALEYGKRAINVNMRAKFNEYADRADNADPWGYRGSMSYIDQWELATGNEIGFSIGYSRWDSGNPEETFSTSSNWKVCQTSIDPQDDRCTDRGGEYTVADQAADAANGIVANDLFFVPHSYYWRLNNAEVEVRDALMGAFEWRSDNADFTFDWFWSDKYYEDDRHDFIIADSRREPRNVVHTPDYALLSFTGVSRMKSDGELYRRDETLQGFGVNWGYTFNDNWEARVDVSSNNHERNRVRRYVRTQSDYVQYDMMLENGLPTITFYQGLDESFGGRTLQTDFDPNNLLTFGGRAGSDGRNDSRLRSDFEIRNRMTDRETKADGITLDAIWTPDNSEFLENLKLGVRESSYQRITNNEDDNRKDVEDILDDYYPEGSVTLWEIWNRVVDECAFETFPNDSFFSNSGSGNIGGSFAAFDTLCATRVITNGQDRLADPDRTFNERDIDVTENTTAAYVMANFSSDNFSVPVWGNFGVRYVDTEVDSMGLRQGYATEQDTDTGLWRVFATGSLEPIRHVHSEKVWLPSANVNFEMNEDFMIRAAFYRAMSRFNIEFMGAARSFSFSEDDDFDYETRQEALQDELGSASGGNPYIDPFTSWNGDVSFEWYLSDDTAISAALYYKHFEAEVASQVEQEILTIDGVDLTVDVRKPVLTGDTSSLWGIEFTASHVFSNLPSPYDGLGFKFSWNHSDTDFESQDPLYGDQIQSDGSVLPGLVQLVPASIFGQSDDIATLQLFWDIGDLNMAVYWKHRSEYYQPNAGDPRVSRWFDDSSYVDVSATYRFNDVWKMRFTAQNLTDEAQLGQRGLRHDAPTLWNSSGVRYEIGVTAQWD